MGTSPGEYDIRLLGLKPFTSPTVMRTLYYLSDGNRSSLCPEDFKVFNKHIILIADKFERTRGYEDKLDRLIAYNLDDKSSHTLRSDIRSENLVLMPSGNLYFLTEKGITRMSGHISNTKTILNCKKVRGMKPYSELKIEWEVGYMFNLMYLYISPDESIALIEMYNLSTPNEPRNLYSFDLRKKTLLRKMGVFYHNNFFTPDSKKILIPSSNSIDVYDTSLNKLSTLIDSRGGIVSCGDQGFVLFKGRFEEDNPKSMESYRCGFSMYNWQGKLLFKFQPAPNSIQNIQ
jgi:hypothetical protein